MKVQTLISEADIATRVAELAADIARDYAKEAPLVVPLLRGSFIFAADLVRALSRAGVAPQVDFMTLGSYGDGTQSRGKVAINRDVTEEVEGRAVLLLDDILESGRTLTFARRLMQERGAASVKIMVLLEKPGKRAVEISADYVGFEISDQFVVGYGLDWANNYRELPFIGVVEE